MNAIGKGDFVEAVRSVEGSRVSQPLVGGTVYRVSEVGRFTNAFYPCDTCGDEEVIIRLHGDPGLPLHRGGHCSCELRPLYSPTADLIEGLLNPVPADAPADLVRA